MPAEKIGSLKCITSQKVLPANAGNPRFEVTVPSGSGTLAGAEIFQAMATFRASGIGTFTEDGGAAFKGIAYFQTSAPSLSNLNGAAVVYNWDVDGEGNATWELWEWK